MMKYIFLLLTIPFSSCMERNTTDPIEAYTYWSGEKPSKEVNVINAKYWQSPHFTLEYNMYMEIKTTKEWRKEFIKQNSLILSIKEDESFDKPTWFKPSDKHHLYLLHDSLRSNSKYYIDTIINHLFIYENQL